MSELIRLIFGLPKKYILFCFLVILISISMSFCEVVVLYSIKPFIQSFAILGIENNADIDLVFKSSKNFLLTVLICGGLRVFLIFFQYRIAALISSRLSSKAFAKIVNQEYIILKSANQSKFLSILIQDIPRTSEAISNLASFVSNIIILIFISISLLFIETQLFIISGILISITYFLILLAFSKKLKINGDNITKYNHKEASLVRSTLASIVDFIVGGSSGNQIKEFSINELRLRKSYSNTLFYSQSPRYIVETFCLSLFTIFIIVSSYSQTGLLIFAQLGTLLFAFNRVLPAAQQIYSAYAFINASSLSIKNLGFILNLRSKIKNYEENKNINLRLRKIDFNKKVINKISLHNLKFQYNNNKKIIYEDYEFTRGLPTAIIGKSGSGKTTLVELILKLLKPIEGQIKLNNTDIKNLDTEWYYQNVSYLAQSPFLFSGSIYENIIFGNKNTINMQEVYENGKILGLQEEFGSNFLDYQISDFGRNISGGQAQRCSLLKIISNIKPIVIIDEPSSALDRKTTNIFNELLFSKTKDSILIVITHSNSQSNLFPSKLNLT